MATAGGHGDRQGDGGGGQGLVREPGRASARQRSRRPDQRHRRRGSTDNFVVQALGGADTVTMTVGVTGAIPLHMDGGEGDDTARYNGSNGPDPIALLRNGTEVATTSPASALFETANVEASIVSGLDGDDTIAARTASPRSPHSPSTAATATTTSAAVTEPTSSTAARRRQRRRQHRRRQGLPRRRRRPLPVGPRRRQRHRRRPGRQRPPRLQRLQHRRTDRAVRQRRSRSASPATSPRSPWTSTASKTSTSAPSAAPTPHRRRPRRHRCQERRRRPRRDRGAGDGRPTR